jgi:hypothetical protein
MVERPYHDYATSALCELRADLASSQAQLEDQRADYARRSGSHDDDLRELRFLLEDLGHHLAAVDRELARRDRASGAASRQRDPARQPGHVRRHDPRGTRHNPKPHCRAKMAQAAARRPQ